MRRLVSLVTVLALCLFCLTGCMGSVCETVINEDGSGAFTFSAGMTEEALVTLQGMDSEGSTEIDLSEYTSFEYDGVTYYGEVETVEFDSVAEFNDLLNGALADDGSDGYADDSAEDASVDAAESAFELVKLPDGDLQLSFLYSPELTDTSEYEQGMSVEQFDLFMDDFCMVFKFTFPGAVKQVDGETAGVNIDGNVLTIDCMELAEVAVQELCLIFECGGFGLPLDVPGSAWYMDSVQHALVNGWIELSDAGLFEPDVPATREAIAYAVMRMLGGASDVDYGFEFTDVPVNSEYYLAVQWSAQNGLMTGYGNGDFGYGDTVTREQLVAVLYRIAQGLDPDSELMQLRGDLSKFDDVSAVSTWASDAVSWAVGAGLMNGTSEVTLTPVGNVTRSQVAALLMRFEGLVLGV